jgi:predicted transcriptional regulator
MVQLLVQLDDETARALERVAPGRSRKRSRFIRLAIRKALMDLEETHTREAYRHIPDSDREYFDPGEWEPKPRRRR